MPPRHHIRENISLRGDLVCSWDRQEESEGATKILLKAPETDIPAAEEPEFSYAMSRFYDDTISYSAALQMIPNILQRHVLLFQHVLGCLLIETALSTL